MTERQILEGVKEVIRHELRLKVPLSPSTNLVRDLQLDSLQQLTLVIEIENRFQIRLDAGDEQEAETLQDVARLIHRRVSEKAPRA